MDLVQDDFARAELHMRESEERVARQRARVEQIEQIETGGRTHRVAAARELLANLEITLDLLRDQLRSECFTRGVQPSRYAAVPADPSQPLVLPPSHSTERACL